MKKLGGLMKSWEGYGRVGRVMGEFKMKKINEMKIN
jgi:hypothetical protein